MEHTKKTATETLTPDNQAQDTNQKKSAPKALQYSDLPLPQALFHRLEQIGFTTPTPIQAKAIPVALEGKDILGSAQTGTGKTAAFGVPLVAHLMQNPEGCALVLLPTRELAVQVMKAFKDFLGREKIKTALLIGGEDIRKQFRQLKEKPRLVVATPGRANDHLDRKTLKLHKTDFLVLDEVDRMLDMGFGIQLDAIAEYLTAERQTLMFSATLPKNIKMLSAKYLHEPVRISVGETHAIATNIKQEHVRLTDAEKPARLLEELEKRQGSIIIFVKTKRLADKMAVQIRKAGHKADALHGDLRQNKRNHVTAGFRNQKFRILVATDVAARGLDISHIEHVINHDMPQNPEDYIHRIGRTARAGAEGEAINFVSDADLSKWNAVQKLLDPAFKPDKSDKPRGGKGSFRSRRRGGPAGGNKRRFAGKPSDRPFKGKRHRKKVKKAA